MKPEILSGASWNEPSPVDHAAFHERVVAWAVKRFNDKPAEETMLGYFIFAGDGHTIVVWAPWDSPDEKYAIAAGIRAMLADPLGKQLVEAYAFVTEAWAVVMKPGDTTGTTLAPSQHPDREDVFQIWTTMRDGSTKMTHFGVKSYPGVLPFLPPKKKPRLLERDDRLGEGTEMAGVMFNFFDSVEELEKKIKQEQAKAKRQQKRNKKEKDQ